MPLNLAISSAVLKLAKPLIVAFTMFLGLFEPKDLALTSFNPANSNTALAGPPAITPVPSLAGLMITLVAPFIPTTSCGIVLPSIIGILTTFLLASCLAFLTASDTSAALPVPSPTNPFLSPTKTTAWNLL